jgi:cardiolipin synthase C
VEFACPDPLDALATRVLLADAAEQSLDLQYYMWSNDAAGQCLLSALYRAAERDVHVRLLLDNYGSLGADELFCAMDMHPRIEVRLFNP